MRAMKKRKQETKGKGTSKKPRTGDGSSSTYSSQERESSPVRSNDEITKKPSYGGKTAFTRVDEFFQKIIESYNIKRIKRNGKIKFVLVNHIVPTLPHFLRAIDKIGTVSLIIPKSSHKNKNIIKVIKKKYGDVFFDQKNDLTFKIDHRKRIDDWFAEGKDDKNNCVVFLNAKLALNPGEKFLIIDIGGYFSKSLLYIYNNKKLGNALLGVVEDTENGHQKYVEEILYAWDGFCKRTAGRFPFPVHSVARSELKETEDYNVGKSIVESASTILRVNAHTILERMKIIGVIGFGKIGSSIAEHLRQKNVANVIVYEKNPIRQMKASSLGFNVVNRKYLLTNSDMIFGATGNKSLTSFDFYSLKDNVFIASCTSHDDEFGLELINIENKNKRSVESARKKSNIRKYYLGQTGLEKRINLLYRGDAVNFVHGAVNGPYIYSVQAALIVNALKIITERGHKVEKNKKDITFGELNEEEKQAVASSWLSVFEGFEYSIDDFTLENENIFKQLDTKIIKPSFFYAQFAFSLGSSCSSQEEFNKIFEIFYFLYNLARKELSENDDHDEKEQFKLNAQAFFDYRSSKSIGIDQKNIPVKEFDLSKVISMLFERKLFQMIAHLFSLYLYENKFQRKQDQANNIFYYSLLSCLKVSDDLFKVKELLFRGKEVFEKVNFITICNFCISKSKEAAEDDYSRVIKDFLENEVKIESEPKPSVSRRTLGW